MLVRGIGYEEVDEMLDRAKRARTTEPVDSREPVAASERTKVILMAQVVTIVALLVLWSIMRSKRACTPTDYRSLRVLRRSLERDRAHEYVIALGTDCLVCGRRSPDQIVAMLGGDDLEPDGQACLRQTTRHRGGRLLR